MMLRPLLETLSRLHNTKSQCNRTARPNLALLDRLLPVEATKAGRLEVAMEAADMVEWVVATEALLHRVADDKSLSTMSVILNPWLFISSELSLTRFI